MKRIFLIILLFACVVPLSRGQMSRKDSLRALRDTAKVLMLDVPFFNRYNVVLYQKYDTTLDKVRLYEPTYEVYHFNASNGNMGQAHPLMIFSVNPATGFDHGFHSFDHYWFDENNLSFYKTKRPYTELKYTLGSKSEQHLNLLHTQQIVPGLQLGLHYRHYYAEGFYQRQDAVYNNFRFFANYFSKSDRYKMTFHFTHNDSYVEENGGLENDSTFIRGGIYTSGGFSSTTNRELYPVNLSNALNRWYNNSLTLQQSFIFLRKQQPADSNAVGKERDPLFTLVHKIHYNNAEFRFRDDAPDKLYYGASLVDTNLTRHSKFYQLLENEVKAIFYLRKKFESRSPLIVGARHQYICDSMTVNRNQGDTLEPDSLRFSYISNNLSVFANFRLDITEQLGFEGRGEYFLAGYNQNNFLLGFSTYFKSKDSAKAHHRVSAEVLYRQYSAAYNQIRIITNHTSWLNSFGPQRLIHINAKYEVPEWNLWVRGNIYLLNNYIYFDTLGTPKQTAQFNSIFVAEAYKKVRFWKFFWANTVAGQYASTDVVRVPNFIIHSDFYFETVMFKKSLLFRIGFDAWYFTSFKANAYDPLTSLYHLQEQKTTGNYPYLDVYISGRIKTVRVFFRLRNVNQRIPSIPYFLTPGYPMQDRSFQLGVSWGFYN